MKKQDSGCEWELIKGTDHKSAIFCHKLVDDNSIFCPKHRLMFQELENELKRRMERARQGKERKALERKALEESPLRIVDQGAEQPKWKDL